MSLNLNVKVNYLQFRQRFSTNYIQFGEIAKIEAQLFRFEKKMNRGSAVELCIELAILSKC
jgi:hypothetical protein